MIQHSYQPEVLNDALQATQKSPYRFASEAYKMIVKSVYRFAHNTFVGFQIFVEGMEYSGYQPPRN